MNDLEEADTYPLWTIRFTWSVLGSDDRPTWTYTSAASETEAIERAVFALDRYDDSGERLLASAHVKGPEGWSSVSGSDARRAQHAYLYAFQRPPVRPH